MLAIQVAVRVQVAARSSNNSTVSSKVVLKKLCSSMQSREFNVLEFLVA